MNAQQKMVEYELKEVEPEDDYLQELYDEYGIDDSKTEDEEFDEYLDEMLEDE